MARLSVLVLLLAVGCVASVGTGGNFRVGVDVPGRGDETHGEVVRGLASYYGDEFAGRPTASGEAYDPDDFTAAHRTLPFGTRLRVRVVETGDEVVVRVNDRGPFVEGRVLDVSKAAARALGMIAAGVIEVEYEVLK
jgi:rare lipoprotein A